MIGPTLILLVIAAIALESLSQFMARLYWENKDRFYLMILAWVLYFGVVSILVLMYDYSKVAISNGLWDAGTIIALSLVGYFYFGEPLNWGEMSGLALVVIGALVIGFTTKEKGEDD